MVARTHGQVATPTTFSKEIQVFEERLKEQQNNKSRRDWAIDIRKTRYFKTELKSVVA